MKKVINVINIVLSFTLLLLAYIPACVKLKDYYASSIGSYIWHGVEYSYGVYMSVSGLIMIGALAISVFLSFTKYYFTTIAPAIVNLFMILHNYFELQHTANINYITKDFIVVLIIIVAICIILNSIWAIANYILEKCKISKITETVIKQEIQQSNADELKKYKDLLDSAVITQEEFEVKKKQLLDL